jgi:hypothetical protein
LLLVLSIKVFKQNNKPPICMERLITLKPTL